MACVTRIEWGLSRGRSESKQTPGVSTYAFHLTVSNKANRSPDPGLAVISWPWYVQSLFLHLIMASVLVHRKKLDGPWYWKERSTQLAVADETDAGDWTLAHQFPSEIHSELIKAGQIPDPYISFNEHKVQCNVFHCDVFVLHADQRRSHNRQGWVKGNGCIIPHSLHGPWGKMMPQSYSLRV